MMFTSCPDCSRQFRVRASQLAAAEGLVQCGYCGKQFNALERLYDKPLPPANETPPGSAPGSAPTETATSSTVATETQPEPEFFIPDITEKAEILPETENRTDHESLNLILPDVEQMARELNEEEDKGIAISWEDEASQAAAPADENDNDGAAKDVEIEEPLQDKIIAEPGSVPIEPVIAGSDDSVEFPFPSELEETPAQKAGWVSRLLWTFGVLLLLLVGAAQAAWFNRDILLSRYPQLLPHAKLVCEQLQCTLIRNRNISAIKLVNRDVRVHPRYENALLVNATITNLSKYTQQFPTVLLTLFDPNGQIMGYRKIPPETYLDNSIDIEAGMTSNAPIHFVFEVSNDKQEAVSFEFDFL